MTFQVPDPSWLASKGINQSWWGKFQAGKSYPRGAVVLDGTVNAIAVVEGATDKPSDQGSITSDQWELAATAGSGGEGGVTDHGLLNGLDGDDHLQYHTDARGDSRYYLQSQVDASQAAQDQAHTDHINDLNNPHQVGYGQLSDVPTAFPPTPHTHTEAQITDLDKYNQATVDAKDAAIQAALDTHVADTDNPHNTTWGNLPGIPAEFPPSAHTHVEAEITDLDRLRYRGLWAQQSYNLNDTVLDAGVSTYWTMRANKDTSERAAPQADNNEIYTAPDAPVWVTKNYSGSVESGMSFTPVDPVVLVGYQIWTPAIGADIRYTIRTFAYSQPDMSDIVYNEINSPTLAEDAWTTVTVRRSMLFAGTTFGIIVNALNSGTDVIVGPYDWTYGGAENTALPPSGQWNKRNQNDIVRIHKVDVDGINRGADGDGSLEGIIPGSNISIVNKTDATSSIGFTVTGSPTYDGTVYVFPVTHDGDGTGGEPGANDVCVVTITVPIPAPTEYVEIAPNATGHGQGILRLDGVDQPGADANLYGVRALYDTITVPADWNIVSWVGSGGGGGGGEGVSPTTFAALTDTPTTYAGQSGLVASVRADETGLEFTAPGVTSFVGLTDTPAAYSGQIGKLLAVNSGETGLEFVDLSGGGIPEAPIDGLLYGRKDASWLRAAEITDLANYVAKAGDTMTGDLGISTGGWASLNLFAPDGSAANVWGYYEGNSKWVVQMPDQSANRNFAINWYDDTGAWQGNPFVINGQSGVVSIGQTTITGALTADSTAAFNGGVNFNSFVQTTRADNDQHLIINGGGARMAPFISFYNGDGDRRGYIQMHTGNTRLDVTAESGYELRLNGNGGVRLSGGEVTAEKMINVNGGINILANVASSASFAFTNTAGEILNAGFLDANADAQFRISYVNSGGVDIRIDHDGAITLADELVINRGVPATSNQNIDFVNAKGIRGTTADGSATRNLILMNSTEQTAIGNTSGDTRINCLDDIFTFGASTTAPTSTSVLNRVRGDNRYTQTAAFRLLLDKLNVLTGTDRLEIEALLEVED